MKNKFLKYVALTDYLLIDYITTLVWSPALQYLPAFFF